VIQAKKARGQISFVNGPVTASDEIAFKNPVLFFNGL